MIFFILIMIFLPYPGQATQEQRIRDFLTVKDFAQAQLEAHAAFTEQPDSLVFFKLYLEALSKAGKSDELTKTWSSFQKKHPEIVEQNPLLEILAWGIIEQGGQALTPSICVAGLSAADKAHNARGDALLEKGLSHRNAYVRLCAVQLATKHLTLKQSIFRLAFNEPQLHVRLEAVAALGRMQVKEAMEPLKGLVAADNVPPQLKAAAIEALVLLLDTLSREELAALIKSERMGLRYLACRAVLVLGLKQDADLLIPLLSDSADAVRIAAIQALGVLDQKVSKQLSPLLEASSPKVALAAAWYFSLQGERGMLGRFLNHPEQEIRLMAASALATSGHVGEMEEELRLSSEPLVQLNLALGLVRYRYALPLAERVLSEQFTNSQKWMWQEEGIWRAVAPSKVFHARELPELPKVVDQLVRLELLKMLFCLDCPEEKAKAVRTLLTQSVAQVLPLVMDLSLMEGDKQMVESLKLLLEREDKQMRAYAALLLSLWEGEKQVAKELQKVYLLSTKQTKELILKAIGEMQEKEQWIEFLVERVEREPMHRKVLAAASLLQLLQR